MRKNILIYGIGKSGVACANFCANLNTIYKKILLYDDNIKDFNQMVNFNKKKNIFCLNKISTDLFKEIDMLIISPSIAKNNKYILMAKKFGISVVSELEFAYQNCFSNILAVTGTNGKTTTVSLISHIFKTSKIKNDLVGNVGVPMIEKVKSNYIKICEVSSFQLEHIESFRPKIAAILNITPDHLNRHGSFKKYIKEKCKIFKNMKGQDCLLLNFDDKILRKISFSNCKVFYFSTKEKVKGVFLINNKVFYSDDGLKQELLINMDNVGLIGMHNFSNILVACFFAKKYGINKKYIQLGVDTFKALPHRLNFVAKYKNLKFINDSKATNIDSCLVATKSFKEKIILLLGGSDKGYTFEKLFKEMPNNVVNIIVYGETGEIIKNSALSCNFANIVLCKDLKKAIEESFKFASNDYIVLLSPACASFDEFKNYKERGTFFENYVKELIEKFDK